MPLDLPASQIQLWPRGRLVAGVIGLLFVAYRRWRHSRLLRQMGQRKLNVARETLKPLLDTRRKAAISKGQAIDHTGSVVEVEDPTFTLDGTIFASVRGLPQRAIMRKTLCRVPHWPDDVIQGVGALFAAVPQPPLVDNRLTDFMLKECNFKMEHADGSFMDHISFCHDYCAEHYKGRSPRVLLLHSILGVATNIFPMETAKIPMLEELISTEEMKHVEVFPSFLRLLVAGLLLPELTGRLGSLEKLQKVSVRRVIDNKVVEIDADALWTQLNYQVIHMLDFLPVADWPSRTAEPTFQVFIELRSFLTAAGKLQAKVDLGSACSDKPQQEQLLASTASPWARIKRKMASRAVRNYSAEIGHDLECKFHWL
mmetsp:Transcript_83680/g.217836  ORF Transcript_83680/g.217836 Transcript_83680/m.217836 type:complete len:370 (-) Transcript_83680:41-1150(-)